MHAPKPSPLSSLTLALLLVAPLASGCGDTETCQKFAEHLAEVLAKEHPDAKVSSENRDKMIKDTAEKCVSDKPEKEHLECAIKAGTLEAMEACEPEKKAE